MNSIFFYYYRDIYKADPEESDAVKLSQYLALSELPQLAEAEAEEHEKPLTVQGVEFAMMEMPKYKDPDPDGYQGEFYSSFAALLAAPMQAMLVRQEELILIAKKGKCPLLCDGYQPIALINSEAKILASVLAIRIQPVITHLILEDQTAFIPGRGTANNLIKVASIMYGHRRWAEGLADNLLVCLSNPRSSFPTIYQCLQESAEFSGLRINQAKTEHFPVSDLNVGWDGTLGF